MLLMKANTVEARLKYYRYDADIPMVEMSLNMMVAMGVLEQIPGRLVHDGNPYNRVVNAKHSPYSRSHYSSPVSSRYYNKYRYNDYWDEPISPYSRSYGSRYGYSPDPWYRSGGDYRDSPWSSRWDYPRYTNRGGPWGNQWNNPWNTTWGSPWGNSWNSQWMNPWSSSPYGYMGGWPLTPGYSTMPLSPDSLLGDDWSKQSPYQSDDSLQQYRNKDSYSMEKTSWLGQPSRAGYKRARQRSVNRKPQPKLNGLWIGNDGEMLGIRGNGFLWYDDDNQYAKGQLLKSPTMMKVRIEGANTVNRYHYRLHGNELVIISRDGKMRTFNRMPLMQPHHASAKPHTAYSSYKPESDNYHVSYSSYGSNVATPENLYPRNQSGPITSAPDINRRFDSVAPRKYYSSERSGIRNSHTTHAVNHFINDIPAASRPVDNGNSQGLLVPVKTYDSYTATSNAAYIKDAINKPSRQTSYTGGKFDQTELRNNNFANGGDKRKPNTPITSIDAYSAVPTTTIPMFKRYKPAAAKANLSSDANPVVSPAIDTDVDSNTWNSSSAGADMNDPNTYLYSYLKDNDNTRTSSSSHSGESLDQAASTSTYTDNSHNSTNPGVAVKNESLNIWKPNNLFPIR